MKKSLRMALGEKPDRTSVAAEPISSTPDWPYPEFWLEKLATAGDPIPTLVPPLDGRLRGGMRPGRLCVLGGGPGSCKTALALQIGARMAKSGAAVAYLPQDEGPEAAAVRLAQHLGISREDAERGTPSAIAALALTTGSGARFHLLDPDEIRDFRSVFEGIKSWPQPRVVIIDSLQKIALADEPELLHQAISLRVDATRRAAREAQAIVFLVSELSRSGYAGGRDRVAGIASFKNSGGIEYGADVAVVLRVRENQDKRNGDAEDDSHVITAEVVKNRLGSKGRFTLQLNPETCLLSEVNGEEVRRQQAATDADRFEALVAKVSEVLQTAGQPLTGSQIFERVRGRRQDLFAALETMERTGRAKSVVKGRSFLWSLTHDK